MNGQAIGVAGCGRMGLPMAQALSRAGFEVWGFDIRPPSDFGDFAPRMIEDPAVFAARCPTVITVVRDVPQTEALLFDEQAILQRDGTAIETLIISSTVSTVSLNALRARVPETIAMIDAPMSGAQIAAEEARLSFMLGGAAADLDRCQPLFEAMGAKLHRMGGFGAGMTAKVLNNYVAATSTVAVRRVLGWAAGHGVERERMLSLMHDSSGQTWFGSGFDQIEFAKHGYAPDNSIGLLEKDVKAAIHTVGEAEDDPFHAALLDRLAGLTDID
ncbi:MAG: NAD(P)-binding domain-containing protein [Pseudomonadota bacterium]